MGRQRLFDDILTKVSYDCLPDLDIPWVPDNFDLVFHEIDGALFLEFATARPRHIGWTQDFLEEAFSICVDDKPLTTNTKRIDVSRSAIWAPLVGQRVRAVYEDAEQMVLQLRGEDGATVFCCTFEVLTSLRDYGKDAVGFLGQDVVYCSQIHPNDLDLSRIDNMVGD